MKTTAIADEEIALYTKECYTRSPYAILALIFTLIALGVMAYFGYQGVAFLINLIIK
jgi:hypothetical protein